MPNDFMERIANKTGGQLVDMGGDPNEQQETPETDGTEKVTENKPAEPTPETKPEAGAKQDTPPVNSEINKYKVASELFGWEADSEETFNQQKTTFFEKANKAEEYAQELEKIRAEKASLESTPDWKKYFDKEEDFKFMQLKKQFPDLNANVLQTVIYSDTSKVPPLEVLAKLNLLKDGDIYSNEQEAMEAVYADFGLAEDTPFEEQERSVQLKVKKAAKQARLEFETIKQSVKMPDVPTAEVLEQKNKEVQERQSRIREAVEPLFSKKIPESIKKIDFKVKEKNEKNEEVDTELFSFEIGEGYMKSAKVQSLLKRDKDLLIGNAPAWDEKAEKDAMDLYEERLKADYLYHNRALVLQSFKDKVTKELSDKYHFEVHNPKPLNDTAAPKTEVTDAEKQAEAFKAEMKERYRRR